MQGEADDAELIRRTAAGDRAALAALLARHRDAAWRVIRYRVSDDSAAEDALQETFLGVWRGAAAFRGEGSVRGWVLGLARRQAARTWRRRKGEPDRHDEYTELGAAESLGQQAGWSAPDPERAVQRAEEIDLLHRALDSLRHDDREVLILRDLEGLTAPEAAAALGVEVGALKSRLHRARLRLMAELRADDGDGRASPGGVR